MDLEQLFSKAPDAITRADVINVLSEAIYPQARAVYEQLAIDIDACVYPANELRMLDAGYSIQTIKIEWLFDMIRFDLDGIDGDGCDPATIPDAVAFLTTYHNVYALACRQADSFWTS